MVKISEKKGMIMRILNELVKQNVVMVIVMGMQESSKKIQLEIENKVLFEKIEENYVLSGLIELSECVFDAVPTEQTAFIDY